MITKSDPLFALIIYYIVSFSVNYLHAGADPENIEPGGATV